ncbi:MAG: ABC transporter permease, partial [Oscillospiraceae bacterium]|nr:ABC transporter permease [Oscillospiraceae bacterium]
LFLKAIIKSVLIFLVSVWVTGILSMINSVNTSVLNRSTELMMLRSLGMTEKQLRESVLLETVMFSSAAAVTGTGAGTLLFTGVSNMLAKIYSEPLPEITGMVIAVVSVTLAVNLLIALLSALPAVRALGKVENIARTE